MKLHSTLRQELWRLIEFSGGDKNTKFIHNATIQQRSKNRMNELRKEDGSIIFEVYWSSESVGPSLVRTALYPSCKKKRNPLSVVIEPRSKLSRIRQMRKCTTKEGGEDEESRWLGNSIVCTRVHKKVFWELATERGRRNS